MDSSRASVKSINILFGEMATKRKYELKKRAERLEETRRRITEATVDLHRTIGPAATHISEVARKAGVERVTVYNHFPDQRSLLAACSAHWRALHPAPDIEGWRALADPHRRLREALGELYAWYRETEPMTANVLRDAEALPVLGEIIRAGLGRYLDQARAALIEPFRLRGRTRDRVNAAARVAVDFHVWRALSTLGDKDAAELAASLVEHAARPRG
jgi:AcrR family transcriptional regulator